MHIQSIGRRVRDHETETSRIERIETASRGWYKYKHQVASRSEYHVRDVDGVSRPERQETSSKERRNTKIKSSSLMQAAVSVSTGAMCNVIHSNVQWQWLWLTARPFPFRQSLLPNGGRWCIADHSRGTVSSVRPHRKAQAQCAGTRPFPWPACGRYCTQAQKVVCCPLPLSPSHPVAALHMNAIVCRM
jgi:hypothetical protein